MYILGISCYYHDSAAVLIDKSGKIIAAAQEERFTRKKHDDSFPENAIKYCLQEAAITLVDIDYVVYYEKPLLKFERILETFVTVVPKGFKAFIYALPLWLKGKIFLRKTIKNELKNIDLAFSSKAKILFVAHHHAHAASAYYPSPFTESAILTIDGVGEWTTCAIAHAQNNSISFLKEMHFPHSLGMLYSSFTYFLGFKVNAGEYKMMGLAPFGNIEDPETTKFKELIRSHLVTIYDDGSIHLNMEYFAFHHSLLMVNKIKWEHLFGIKFRNSEDEINQSHCNLALAIQSITEEIVIKLAKHTQKITGSKNLCLAGGVALNCVANGVLQRENIFENIYIQAASGDAGGALGAALATYHEYAEMPKKSVETMQGCLLGEYFSEKEIEHIAKKYNAVYIKLDNNDINSTVAELLSKNMIIGRFCGRTEFGPRALGNRSIIASPLEIDMQQKLNLKIKFREGFRPFAPAIMKEYLHEWFDLQVDSPYMLLVAPLLEKHRFTLPQNYSQLTYLEKLKTPRSKVQSITHVDFSA
jgi:carbamoyltransferase